MFEHRLPIRAFPKENTRFAENWAKVERIFPFGHGGMAGLDINISAAAVLEYLFQDL